MTEFLSPISHSLLDVVSALPQHAIGKQLQLHDASGFPDVDGVQLVILGIKEVRKDHNADASYPCFDSVRASFYELFPGNWHLSIADLGDIHPGETVEDTYAAVKTVVSELLQKQIIPIVIGG